MLKVWRHAMNVDIDIRFVEIGSRTPSLRAQKKPAGAFGVSR